MAAQDDILSVHDQGSFGTGVEIQWQYQLACLDGTITSAADVIHILQERYVQALGQFGELQDQGWANTERRDKDDGGCIKNFMEFNGER